MSCEHTHRGLVADILALAGMDTVDPDTIIRMGKGYHLRRQSNRTDTPWGKNLIPTTIHHTLGVHGHADHTPPKWVEPLIANLMREYTNGNRRAFLTLQLMLHGGDAVTPYLTDEDAAWIQDAKRLPMVLPPAWNTFTNPVNLAMHLGCDQRSMYTFSMRYAITLKQILEESDTLNSRSTAQAHHVSPRQVLRLLLNPSFASRTEFRQALQAVLDQTPAAQRVIDHIRETRNESWIAVITDDVVFYREGTDDHVTDTLLRRISASLASQMEPGSFFDVVLNQQTTLRNGLDISPTAIRDPSPHLLASIGAMYRSCSDSHLTTNRFLRDVTTLVHVWRTGGRHDAADYLIHQIVEDAKTRLPALDIVLPLLVANGTIRPPHGDDVIRMMLRYTYPDTPDLPVDDEFVWTIIAATAIYSVTCEQMGHDMHIPERDTVIRDRWSDPRYPHALSPAPLLAIGNEHDLLLPVLRKVSDPGQWSRMICQCIDAMEIMHIVGGSARGLQSVIATSLSDRQHPLQPDIIIRLAASRIGQTILARLPTIPSLPPVTEEMIYTYEHVMPHLVSPWWETAPPPLRDWWTNAIKEVSEWSGAGEDIPLIYASVHPLAAMALAWESPRLIAHAINHPAWPMLPEQQRERLLNIAGKDVSDIELIASAATDAALTDIRKHAERTGSAAHADLIRWLIDGDTNENRSITTQATEYPT